MRLLYHGILRHDAVLDRKWDFFIQFSYFILESSPEQSNEKAGLKLSTVNNQERNESQDKWRRLTGWW